MTARGREVGATRRVSGDSGQATVELALVLPFLVALMFAIAQVGLVVRAQIMSIHAAREGARVVAVDPAADVREAVLRAARLDGARTVVTVSAAIPGEPVTVTVQYDVATELPLIGPLLGDVLIEAEATMLVEGQSD